LKWLKDIFGKKSANEEPAILQLEKIDSWLEERANESDFAVHCKDIYDHMDDAAKTLSKDISALEFASSDDATPPKLLRAGLAARGEVVKQLETLSSKLVPPKKNDLDSIFQHHWTLVKGLERTVTTFGRAQRYVAALFPRNIESINSDLTKISRHLVDLEEEIGKMRKMQEESWYSKEIAERLKEGLSSIDDLFEKTQQDSATLSELSSQLSSLEEEAKKLEASDEGKRLQELKSTLEKKKEEKSEAEVELNDLIAPLNKALARMMKQGSSDRINLQHKNVFEHISVSPSAVQDKDIAGSLKELQSHLATLGLKDKKKEKVLDHIEQLIKRRSLEDARFRLQAIDGEIMEMESAIKESSREGQRLKDEMSRSRKSKKSMEAALDKAKKDLASLKEKAASDELELGERLTRIAGRPIKLDLSSGRRCW
jgi:DNA repair exonuclease SbcCD ATPase subunit